VTRSVVIAGAGIGGLTAALALAKRGFQVSVIEQAAQLEAIGAGIQLSPNASRVLIALGLGYRLTPYVVAPTALNVINATSGEVLAHAPLDDAVARRYGAPFWVIHRGDLHTVLREAVAAMPQVALHCGARVEDFAIDGSNVTVRSKTDAQSIETRGDALVGADGLWSVVRDRLGHHAAPRFAEHSAWRALVAPETLPPALRAPSVNLWLGRDAHLVHYPVRGGNLINVVAIVRDRWREAGWSAVGARAEIIDRFSDRQWHAPARELIGAAASWQKWALYDCRPLRHWGAGPVTLLGDAAHPMLPYLAQGAAMAIEDAAVLATSLAQTPDDPSAALRYYEALRRKRTARTQRAARHNGAIYHLGGAAAVLRTLALRTIGGTGLLRRYDWLYRWQPD
jgi:salicylate hydroxylase